MADKQNNSQDANASLKIRDRIGILAIVSTVLLAIGPAVNSNVICIAGITGLLAAAIWFTLFLIKELRNKG